MSPKSPNFGFLSAHDELLVKYAARAERYVFEDPNTTFVKLRQFIETLSALAAAHAGIRLDHQATLADTLHALRGRRVFDDRVSEYFRLIQRTGNQAVHEHLEEPGLALRMLKLARHCAIWFHRAYGNDPRFKPGPFVPPPAPVDASDVLRRELSTLQEALADANRQIDEAVESAQAAEARRAEAEAEARRGFEEAAAALALAEETEQLLEAERAALSPVIEEIAEGVASSPRLQEEAAERGRNAAAEVDPDEADTRTLIDAQLRQAGWQADSETMRHAAGVRPQKGRNVAIAEWPTESGPADYVLFRGLVPIAIVEAKRAAKNVSGSIVQAERYSKGFRGEDLELAGPWGEFRVPFVFATNGRPYLKQLEHKSGIHFRDVRDEGNLSRALTGWYTPDDLHAELAKPTGAVERRPVDVQLSDTLRAYQREAISAVEAAIDDGRRNLLLAMATGTGKTRTAICLAYRLIQSKRFRRVLFLVDRSALGEQAANSFGDLRLEQQQTFTQIYDVKGLGDLTPDPETKLHIATVQGMVRRVVYPSDDDQPVPVSWYDCVIIDECHRGYNLDRELSDTELTFRDEADYISKYRRVVEHFDAVRIGLTATPALHTKEIFGAPVFQYGYRRAVIEGHLCDHEPPLRIVTKLARDGIHFEAGSEVTVYEPESGQLDLFETPDELDFDVAEFNRSVLTENFNRAVCAELARRIDPSLAGKTMVFCVTDDHADLVVKLLTEAFQERYGADVVPSDTVRKITGASDKPLQLIRRYKNERRPKVAVTVDLLTTGIDVPEICNLVFLRRVRSRILYEQMIGRATRKCDEIGKEFFQIYDAVDLYSKLRDQTDMKPVVAQPKMTFERLVGELADVSRDPSPVGVRAAVLVQEQLAAKLQRKASALEDAGNAESFSVLAKGDSPGDLVELVKDGAPQHVAAYFADRGDLVSWLDRLKGKTRPPVFISDDEDEVVETSRGYGDGQKPEDYLDSFRDYLETHKNELPALIAVTQRPRELTRAELKALRLKLEEKGFSEKALQSAYRETTNRDIAASIVGYIRKAAIGDPLVAYEERVKRALGEVLGAEDWTGSQRTWLERIGKQMIKELVVDRAALDSGQFRAEGGGFEHLNKVFDGRLEAVLDGLCGRIWEVGA